MHMSVILPATPEALVSLGLEGAILGKSLYANKFTLEEALAIANQKI